MAEKKKSRWFGLQFDWRFELLLLALVVFLGVAPFVDNHVVTGVLAGLVLISTVGAVREGRLFGRAAWTLAILSMLALWGADLTGRAELVIASGVSDIAFYLIMTLAILAYVFRATEVTVEILAAAVCAYLLMGIGWSNVYVVIESLSPGSFNSGALATEIVGGIEDVHIQQGHFLYFSLVTLSTLGYGDVTPIQQPARMLAALEAIVGQLFIGVLIARLVGQQIRPRPNKP